MINQSYYGPVENFSYEMHIFENVWKIKFWLESVCSSKFSLQSNHFKGNKISGFKFRNVNFFSPQTFEFRVDLELQYALSIFLMVKLKKITCVFCHELGSDGEAVGEVAFDDGDGLTSAINGGLLAGVFGDECRGTGCGLSGIFAN